MVPTNFMFSIVRLSAEDVRGGRAGRITSLFLSSHLRIRKKLAILSGIVPVMSFSVKDNSSDEQVRKRVVQLPPCSTANGGALTHLEIDWNAFEVPGEPVDTKPRLDCEHSTM